MAVNRSWIGRMTKKGLAQMIRNSDAVKRDPGAKFIARCYAVTFPMANPHNASGFNVRIYPVRDGRLVATEAKLIFIANMGEINDRQARAETECNRVNRWLREMFRYSEGSTNDHEQ